MEPEVHGPVCDFFVKKDPLKPFGLQSRKKNRALFDPRGHYKTSISIGDTIQWILCFPDITYLKMSGTQNLTKRVVHEMKTHFEQNEVFREVYPEYCPSDDVTRWGLQSEFTVPLRTANRREPTVSIATVDSVKAGSHYDIRDGDDIVNEENSKTKEQLAQTVIDWKHTRPLVNPGGYTQYTGTRYDWSDNGGEIIETNPPVGEVDTLNGFGYRYEGADWNIFARGCWKMDESGKKQLLFPQQFRTDDEDDPERENLSAMQREDPYLFSCQYLNNPAPTGTQNFPRELLLERTVLRANIPPSVTLFMTWYLGFNADDSTDPAVGIVGGFGPDGSIYIIDCYRGLWSTDRMIEAIFSGHKKWCLRKIGIDDKNGPILLGPGLEAKMRENRMYLPMEYLPVKSSEDMKIKSVEALVPLLVSGKLFFSADMPCYDQMLLEFTRFGKYKHAGIPYAIAMLASNFRGAYERIMNQASQSDPIGEITVANHYGMFSDLQGNQEDSQEISAGLVG
ncbi:MAG: hypothetical protein PVS2B2_26120 [Candidatus Acidiferrum sp.]